MCTKKICKKRLILGSQRWGRKGKIGFHFFLYIYSCLILTLIGRCYFWGEKHIYDFFFFNSRNNIQILGSDLRNSESMNLEWGSGVRISDAVMHWSDHSCRANVCICVSCIWLMGANIQPPIHSPTLRTLSPISLAERVAFTNTHQSTLRLIQPSPVCLDLWWFSATWNFWLLSSLLLLR